VTADSTGFAWVEGRVSPLGEARIPITDRGALLGDGLFETLRTAAGRIFQLGRHMKRLAHGLEILGLDASTRETAQDALEMLAEHAGRRIEEDLYLRVQVTRPAGARLEETPKGTVTAIAKPLTPYPRRTYTQGVRLAVARQHKVSHDPLSHIKSLSYGPYIWARRDALVAGFDDALILNEHGRVAEATHSNVIARLGSTLWAPGPGEGALDGVTRQVLLEALAEEGYTVRQDLDRTALAAAEEVVLTNTTAGVIPVVSVQSVRQDYEGPRGSFHTAASRRLRRLLLEPVSQSV
jgi:branched-chain amino acid aminotransferase